MMSSIVLSRKAALEPDHARLLSELLPELERMERMLCAPRDSTPPMCASLARVIAAGGKRLRPLLAFLCYRLGGSTALPIVPLMSMLELMHTASLVHDDVVDSAALRRGNRTINSVYGDAAAVQCGDFLLAEAMEYLHLYRGTGINEALVGASRAMCLGELSQLMNRYDIKNQTIERYFQNISGKTAALIAAACQAGGLAGGLPAPQAEKLKEYGENLGLAFQLRDDLLDFSEQPGSGKTPGQDLKNGILTLPVLHLLAAGVPMSVRNLIVKKDKDDGELDWLLGFIRESASFDYTKAVIRQKTAGAVGALRDFPDSAEKTALTELAESLAERRS